MIESKNDAFGRATFRRTLASNEFSGRDPELEAPFRTNSQRQANKERI
jgi:hypothetical protein